MGERRVTADGRILERQPDGSIVEVGRQGGGQQGTVFTIPGDPYKARSAAAEEERLRMAQGEQSRSAAEWQATHNPDGSPKLKPKEELDRRTALADAQAAYRNMASLEGYVKDLRRQYDANFKGKGIGSIAEYLPAVARPANGVFNDTGQSLLADMAKAKGLTAQQFNTPAEQKMFFEPLIPKAGDTDEQIVSKINRLEQMIGSGKTNYAGQINALGGEAPQQVPNVWDQVNAQGDGPRPIAFGSTGGNDGITQPIPPEANQEYAAYYMQNAGRLNPQEYAAFRQSLAKKYGFEIPPGVDLLQEAAEMNDYYAKGGRGTPSLTPPNKKMSELDWLRNSAVNNPVGAGVANFADSVSMGGVSALQGDRMRALNEANPNAALIGQIGGAVAGSEGLGYLGRQTLGRALPKLMGGGTKATVARQIAQDAVYGAGYGQNVNGDPLGGAVVGGLGSGAGQLGGKALGGFIGGVKQSPIVQRLADAGIFQTTGQRLGGFAKTLEDAATSIPIAGDMIARRRIGSFGDYNRAEFRDVGDMLGASINNTGRDGLSELGQAKNAMYSRTLDPVTIDVTDPKFIQDVADAQLAASRIPDVQPTLPASYARQSLDNRLAGPVGPNGMLGGRDFQESYRGLARDARSRVNSDYGHEIGQTARMGQTALADVLERQNPGAFAGFQTANTANRRISVLADAVKRARSGSRSGEVDTFTPSQMLDAAAKNESKFPGGLNMSLARDAQQVLPSKLPDSGTARRLALQFGSLGALGGGGYAVDGQEGAAKGLALAALLAGGGTKVGQTGINGFLFSRPATAKTIGGAISKQKGLLGSALIPLLLEANQ